MKVDFDGVFRIPLSELRRGEESMKAMRELARSAVEDRFDCLALIKLLNFALPLVVNNRAGSSLHASASTVLQTIEYYFTSNVFVGKTTIPVNTPERNRIGFLHELKKEIAQALRYIGKIPQFIETRRIIAAMAGQLNDPAADDRELLSRILTFVSNESRLPPDAVQNAQLKYAELFKLSFILSPEPGQPLPTDTTILEVASKMGQTITHAEGMVVPPYASHPFTNFLPAGAPSFRDALNLTDEDELCVALLQYGALIPRGNALWNNFHEVMFTLPLRVTGNADVSRVVDKGILEKVVFLRQFVSEQLFLPAIINNLQLTGGDQFEASNRSFNSVFDSFLTRLAPDGVEDFVDALFGSVQFAEQAWGVFHPHGWETAEQLRNNVPLAQTGHRYFRSVHMKNERRFAFDDEAPYTLVRDHLQMVCDDISKRFHSPNTQALVRCLQEAFGESYIERHARRMTEEMGVRAKRIDQDMGIDFIAHLNSVRSENAAVNRDIVREITEKMRRGYSLHPGVNDHIVFTGSSLPALLGFQEVSFQVAPYDQQDILFSLRFRDANIGFRGHVDLSQNGELSSDSCDLSINLESNLAGMEELIKQIVVCSLSDLVTVSRSTTVREIVSTTAIEPVEDNGGDKQTRKRRLASLPRVRTVTRPARVYEPDSLKDEAAVVMEHDPKMRGRVIKAVDAYSRALPGAQEYEAAVHAYIEFPDEAHGILLAQARRNLQRPSADKQVAPPILKCGQRTVVDPITKETVYLDTWVRPHLNPRPTPEEQASPHFMYQRFYRFGPALQMLDSHIWGHLTSQLDKPPVTN